MAVPYLPTSEVFGISTEILRPSYVNRGDLDAQIQRLLSRNYHIALRGEPSVGKAGCVRQIFLTLSLSNVV